MPGLSSAALDRLHQVLARIAAGRDLTEVLQAVTDGVVEVSGFMSAVVSVPHGRHEMEVVAVSGTDVALSGLVGQRFPRSLLEQSWDAGVSYGRFVFTSHELGLDAGDGQPGVLVPDLAPIDHPDAWHPLDELNAPLRTPAGELLGSLGVDRPADGKRPQQETLDLMEVFAMQAALGIDQALQRERLREELWLRGMVNELFSSTGQGPLEQTFEQALPTVAAEMAAADLWVEVFDRDEGESRSWGGEEAPRLVATLSALGPALAEHARRTDRAVVLTPHLLDEDHPALAPQRRQWLRRAFAADGMSRLLVAPLPQGRGLNGQVVLFRRDGRVWSPVEQSALLDVGRALGWAVQRDRALHQVSSAEAEVAGQRDERAAMLRSLAFRVRGWMSQVDDHLRGDSLPQGHPTRVAMESFWALFGRVVKLSEFQAYPERTRTRPVDLRRVVEEVWRRLADRPETVGRDVTLLPVSVEGDVTVRADPDRLEWLLPSVCEDLVHQTRPGGTVRVALVRQGDRVLMSCQSSGGEVAAEDDEPPEQEEPSWWLLGARPMLVRMDARLVGRSGPGHRQAVTLDLPAAGR